LRPLPKLAPPLSKRTEAETQTTGTPTGKGTTQSLHEAYMQVHQPQEEVEQLDENVQDAVKGALEKGANFMKTNPVGKAVSKIIAPVGGGRKTPTATSGGYRKEEIDLFDAILEHLVSEGYADTNESALVIMANMSEEWRQSIVAEASVTDDRVRRNQKAFGSNYTPPRDWDQSANRGKGAVLNAKQKEKQRRKGLVRSAE
jgi:hypothetical protein